MILSLAALALLKCPSDFSSRSNASNQPPAAIDNETDALLAVINRQHRGRGSGGHGAAAFGARRRLSGISRPSAAANFAFMASAVASGAPPLSEDVTLHAAALFAFAAS